MSQETVTEKLKEVYPEWLTVKELAQSLDVEEGSVTVNCKKLSHAGFIRRRKRYDRHIRREINEFKYKKYMVL